MLCGTTRKIVNVNVADSNAVEKRGTVTLAGSQDTENRALLQHWRDEFATTSTDSTF